MTPALSPLRENTETGTHWLKPISGEAESSVAPTTPCCVSNNTLLLNQQVNEIRDNDANYPQVYQKSLWCRIDLSV